VSKKTEAGGRSEPWKKSSGATAMKLTAPELEPEALSWTEELRSWAVSFLRQLRSPVLVKAYS